MTTIIEDRLKQLPKVKLHQGGHTSFKQGHCATEVIAWLAGEDHSDHPKCTSPVLASLLRRFNDVADDELRQRLKPYLPKAVGTAGDGYDELRGWMTADWALRTAVPTWLDLAGVTESAKALRELPEINAETYEQHYALISKVRRETWKRRQAWREKLKQEITAKLKEKGIKAAAAAADADAVAVAAAAAAADADAVADAVAAAVADADAVADAVAAAPWSATYSAVRKAVKPIYEEKLGPTRDALLPSFFDLIDRMCDPEDA